MKNKNENVAKKVGYAARNTILNFIIGILVIFDLVGVVVATGEIKSYKRMSPVESGMKELQQGNYSFAMNYYSTNYDKDRKYNKKDKEFYASMEYYQHASLYIAADACGEEALALAEKGKMDEAYAQMGDNQKYAKEMLKQLTKENKKETETQLQGSTEEK